jgi:DNA-binding ferritin-like protein
MKESIILLRTLNLVYHHMHNIANGCSFAGDHDMLAGMYAALDAEYDRLVERHIGLGNELSRDMAVDILKESAEFMQSMPDSMGSANMNEFFQYALDMESMLRGQLVQAMAGASKGTENLLQDLCDKSEAREYKLRRRIMSC